MVLIPVFVMGQNQLISSKSSMTISGTSSMHDWESVCEKMSGTATFEFVENELKSAKNASLSMKVEDIESGKSLMDSKTYDAFKYESYPMIKGGFSAANIQKSGSKYLIKGQAYLEMAGKKKNVDLSAECSVSETEVTCIGKQSIDMTEYDMKPPTAMMGTIKVGKDVEVEMKLVFKR